MAVQAVASQPATSVQPATPAQTSAPAQTAKIDTQPMKKAYADWSKIIGGLNSQIRNYNIMSDIKSIVVAIGIIASVIFITWGVFSLFGLSIPLTAFSWKVASASLVSVGITILFAHVLGKVIKIKTRLIDAQNKLIAKIKTEFQKNKYSDSDPIIQALFKQLYNSRHSDICSNISFNKLKGKFSVKKIEIDSFEKVEKRYIKYHTYEQKRIERQQRFRRSVRELRTSQGMLKEKVLHLDGALSLIFGIIAIRGAYLAVNMIF